MNNTQTLAILFFSDMTPAYDPKQGDMGAPTWAHMGPKYKIFLIFELNMKENEPRRYSNGFLYGFGSISTKFQPEWTDFGPFQTIFGFWGIWGIWIWHILDLFFDKYMSQP